MNESYIKNDISDLVRKIILCCKEDCYTELLATLLGAESFRSKFIEGKIGELAECRNDRFDIETQIETEIKSGYPDLRISNAETCIYVESKLSAELTANQPEGYLRDLHHKMNQGIKNLALCFIVPQFKKDYYTEQINSRCQNVYEVEDESINQIPIKILTWREISSLASEIHFEHPDYEYIRKSFIFLIPSEMELVELPLTIRERKMIASSEFNESMAVLSSLLRNLRNELSGAGQKVSASQASDFSWLGFYSVNSNYENGKLWIGVHPKLSLAKDIGPIWIHLNPLKPNDVMAKSIEGLGYELHDARSILGWGGWLTPMKLMDDGNEAEFLRTQVKDIENMQKIINGG